MHNFSEGDNLLYLEFLINFFKSLLEVWVVIILSFLKWAGRKSVKYYFFIISNQVTVFFNSTDTFCVKQVLLLSTVRFF